MSPRIKRAASRFGRRYTHSVAVTAALGIVGLVLVYNGTIDVPAIDQFDQDWIIGACLIGGALSVVLAILTGTGRITGERGLDAAMAVGLLAATAANITTGIAWPESLWIVCGYSMAITMAAGATLRGAWFFATLMVAQIGSWLVASALPGADVPFRTDATTLVLVGVFISTAIFIALRLEREVQERLTVELRNQVDRDPLTGVLNRTGLFAGLGDLEISCGGRGPIWCAYIDVDFFKAINDQHGHDYGDEVLCQISGALDDSVGPGGLVARWGGDEFVIVANGPAPPEDVIEERVSDRLGEADIEVSVSSGIAADRWESGVDTSALIEVADQRMYRRRDAARAVTPGQIEIKMNEDKRQRP